MIVFQEEMECKCMAADSRGFRLRSEGGRKMVNSNSDLLYNYNCLNPLVPIEITFSVWHANLHFHSIVVK